MAGIIDILHTLFDLLNKMRQNAIRMGLIKALEKYRLEHKISQQKLADMLEVSFSTINRWLNGKSKPNKMQKYHIEKLLNKYAKEKRT